MFLFKSQYTKNKILVLKIFKRISDEDVSFIVAFDNLPMRPTIFPSWEVPDSAGKEFAPLPWDAHCPSETPDASKLMQRNPSGDDRSEL